MTYTQKAKELLRIEAQAVERCASILGSEFDAAISVIQKAVSQGKKLVLSGVGKSHYIAAKLAASFNSVGVTALFVHPVEAFHGDLGAIAEGDVCLLFSKSGATAELVALTPFLKNRNPIIAITGRKDSPLALAAQVVLDASVEKEACPINMVPTASTTVAMALGDALVSVCSEGRGFSKDIFAGYHPGGSIGKRLTLKVDQVMKSLDEVALGDQDMTLQQVAVEMGRKPQGAFCVVRPHESSGVVLNGLLTEGDVRRAVASGASLKTKVSELMTKVPVSVQPSWVLDEAIAAMEQPGRQIYLAPVVDDMGRLVGVVRLHDLL